MQIKIYFIIDMKVSELFLFINIIKINKVNKDINEMTQLNRLSINQ